jgi:acetoin utilization protein AcuB
MLVSDRMSRHPVTIRTDADYKQALKLMQDHAMHHVPVLDAENKLAGVLAERDLLLAAMHYLQSAIEVSEIMHRQVVTATPDMPISEAAMLMVNNNIGGLPVVDGNQRVVGIITETDIFRAFVELLSQDKAIEPKKKA